MDKPEQGFPLKVCFYRERAAYSVVNDILSSSIVVNVNGDTSQRGDLGGQLIETSVVLALALVGFRHDGVLCRLRRLLGKRNPSNAPPRKEKGSKQAALGGQREDALSLPLRYSASGRS